MSVREEEMRPIDADEITKNEHQHYDYMADEYYVFVRDIENAPTLEVEPVREGFLHDFWQRVSGEIIAVCSECGKEVPECIRGNYIKYCPFCGAKVVDF